VLFCRGVIHDGQPPSSQRLWHHVSIQVMIVDH
jgi:hypothetical protein